MGQNERERAETLPAPPATFHFIGIGGIGMSGLARILTMWGHKVTGSDAAESAQTQALREMGIPVVLGHEDPTFAGLRSEEHTSELQSRENLVCRLLLEKKKTCKI